MVKKGIEMEVFEIDKYINIPDNFKECSVCCVYHPPSEYVNEEGKRRTNCSDCYSMDWDDMCQLKAETKIIVQNNFSKFGEFTCEECEKRYLLKFRYSSDPSVCEDCEENLPNETGYCSMHCRLSGRCDESC